MKKKIEKIVELVYKVSCYVIADNQYNRTFNTIRKLTEEVWNSHYRELLNELERIDNPEANYQLFWLECLGYPRKTPNLFGHDGMPLGLNYGALPSDFNRLLGFHDSKLVSVSRENEDNEDIRMFIELDSWEYERAELTFYNVISSYHLVNDEIVVDHLKGISNFTILSDCEAPNIEYCIRHLKIPDTALSKNHQEKRLFCIFGTQRESSDSLYIFADRWGLKTY